MEVWLPFFGALLVVWLLGRTGPATQEQVVPGADREVEPPVDPIQIQRIELPSPASVPASAASPGPVDVGPARRPEARTVSTEETIVRGRRLLDSGRFPRLRGTYERIGFEAYRGAMERLGARIFFYDGLHRRPVAEIEGELAPTSSELSRWPRDLTRHLESELREGRELHGTHVSRVVLLPPARLDALLLGSVEESLQRRGLDPTLLSRLDLAYEIREGRLGCELLTAGMQDGTEVSLGLHVDLSTARAIP